ncbi:outer membrane beta-barrel protein [Litoribacter ruber]|uniref:Outer membrane beta-barrel protein n=1 Tax=Litoribacter ruber TaxID=702568 RepID=A0AAP2G6E3_9BACT|nr:MULTISPECIES: outer membrane beta-barrel protein [Litoribacter]MBS9525981.1 outer membrane beta-barrel protein [Litoribacter alkaliphilus]MBT0813093.1 outer membrane beta-barrel protein [Litoribacter ruber]
MKKLLLSLSLLMALCLQANAQYSRNSVTLGVGAGFVYGDNAGDYSSLNFPVRPAFTLGYTQEYNDRFDWRVSLGTQSVSGRLVDYPADDIAHWIEERNALDFSGQAYYADFMPIYHFTPYEGQFDFYGGLGLGLMFVNRTDQVLPFGLTPDMLRANDYSLESQNRNTTSLYFPIRLGVTMNLENNWAIGLELGSLIATSPRIDGNNQQWNSIPIDMLPQAQLILRKYLPWTARVQPTTLP